jgi:hypothetical protein
MSSDESLERRVAAVEAEVAFVWQETAAARALAAGADRDVADYRAEMRAHTRGLAALRQTQLAHYAEHKADAAELRADLTEVKAGLTEVRVGVAHIVRLLERADDDGPGDREP